MDELWLFITGNFVDAILFLSVLILFALCVGSLLAAWFSLQDKTQYKHNRRKLYNDVSFLNWLSFRKWNNHETEEFRKKTETNITNLLFLKRIAVQQTVKYGKYFIFYAGLLCVAIVIRNWHMDYEIQKHEIPISQLNNILSDKEQPPDSVQINLHDNKIITVVVNDKDISASYEFVYYRLDNQELIKTMQGQKVLKIPQMLCNVFAVIWLFMICGFRYIRKIV